MQNSSNRPADQTEADLVRDAQHGSADAFTELMRRYRWRMLYAAGCILKNREDAEDAVQAACWSAFQHLPTFRGDSSFRTWLTAVTTNQARMRRRELAREARVFGDEPLDSAAQWAADPAPDPEREFAAAELVEALHHEIRRLPAQLRRAMLLHVQSCSAVELAASLGVSLAAAKARLFRARARLHDRMKPYGSPQAAAV